MKPLISLTYFASIKKNKQGYLVKFRDFDNVFTEGETLQEALDNAQEALDGVLISMAQTDFEIKLPSAKKAGEYAVPVSPDVAAPVLLHVLRADRKKTMSQVAKAMKVSYQQYQRLEANCNMTMQSLRRAAHALGARAEIRFHVDR